MASVAIVVLSSCHPALIQNDIVTAPRSDWSPRPGSDEALMIEYGSMLRRAYKTGDQSLISNARFIEIETDLEARELIDRQTFAQIQKGIVFVGMPLEQALASLEGLVEVDVLVIDGIEIRSFRGATTGRTGALATRDTIISCDGKVINLFVTRSLITKETYNRTFGSTRIRFQNNFPPGYWDQENYEERIRGNRIFEDTQSWGDRLGHHWSMFSDNPGRFTKPSSWYNRPVNLNDMMRRHLRSGRPLCS